MRTVVVTAAIIKRRGKVLITQRPRGSLLPLRWEFPGGRVKKGERLETCLKREIKEELGVSISVLNPYHTSTHVYLERAFEIHYFLCKIIGGEPRALRVKDFNWIKPSKHDSYSILSPDLAVMKRLALQTISGSLSLTSRA